MQAEEIGFDRSHDFGLRIGWTLVSNNGRASTPTMPVNARRHKVTRIDLEPFRAAPLQRDPYEYVMIPGFLGADAVARANADYPKIDKPGNFPLAELTYGPGFGQIIETVLGPEFGAILEEKFNVSLSGLHPIVTVRGFVDRTDGNIHTDSPAKLLTCLIYLNPDWNLDGGRLRLLRSEDDIENYAAEVPPVAGTMLIFKRSDNSWHGFKRVEGPRRSIQVNWVTDAAAASKMFRAPTFLRRVKDAMGIRT